MDACHVEIFLKSQGEYEMAKEVANMSSRLEAFADGLDRAALDAAITAAEEAVQRGAELEQQLTDCKKQLALAREALKEIKSIATSSIITHGYDKHHKQNISLCNDALAATADLSGLVLCDAEPVTMTYTTEPLFRRKQP